MRLLEYEAKRILKETNIPVPRSRLLTSEDGSAFVPVVLKSQVPTGGRGKAGGVRLIQQKSELLTAVNEILNLPIKGFLPRTLLAEEPLSVQHEYYLSLTISKPEAAIQVMVHKNGGIEVEENTRASFLVFSIDSKSSESAGEKLAEYFDIPEQSFALQDFMKNLYDCFMNSDATLIEINPLVLTKEGRLVAGDCKMELDTAADFRHPEWNFEDTPANSNFVTLDEDGTVATIANGAGLAMATVDAVTDFGMKPANFLDIGGGANSESVFAAFQNIMKYPSVKAIVINIFAGITRCDEVAKAIIEARKRIDDLPPLYIRLAGTNVEIARELLADEHIPLLSNLQECLKAAKKEVHDV